MMKLITTMPTIEPPWTKIPWRSSTIAAPAMPKIAPEAPTVGEQGVTSSAPAEPASPDAR